MFRLRDLENKLTVTKGDRWKTNLQLPKGTGGMDLGYGTGTGTLRQGKTGPQEPSVQHRELYPVFCDHPSGKRISKRVEVCLCITESLCGRAEIITTLQINYTSIKCLKNGKKK